MAYINNSHILLQALFFDGLIYGRVGGGTYIRGEQWRNGGRGGALRYILCGGPCCHCLTEILYYIEYL
jgi:hypothetical protein